MRSAPLLALLLSLCFLSAGRAQEDVSIAQAQIDAIEAEIQRQREKVLSSGSNYDRLKAQRALEETEAALREARKSMDEIKKTLKPGTKAWEQEQLIKDGREFRSIPGRDGKKDSEDEYKYGVSVPDVGPGSGLDPRVHQHSWVGEPGGQRNGPLPSIELPTVPGAVGPTKGAEPGEVLYGRPAGFKNSHLGPIRDPREKRHQKEKPSSALPNAPIPPSTGTASSGKETDSGGPILDPNALGESRRSLPPLAPDGFTFDGPEGKLLQQFPELAVRPREEREQAFTLVTDAGRRLRKGDLGGALRSADRLVEISPEDPGVHQLRALVLNRLGRYREAEAAAARALSFDDQRGEAWRTLSWAQFKQGKSAQALKSAERALVLDPEDASALALRAYALERLGQRKQALKTIRKAAAIRPQAFGPIAARAAKGAPVAPAIMAPASAQNPIGGPPLWLGGLVLGGMFFGAGWFVFKAK